MLGRLLNAVRRLPRPGRRGLMIGVAALLGATFVIGGLAQVRLETTVRSFLPSNDPSVQRLDDLGRSFGGDPIVVLLESPKPNQLLDQQHVPAMLRMEGELAKIPGAAAVYGPATTLNQIAGRAQALLAELTGRRDGVRQQAVTKAKAGGASETAAKSAGAKAAQDFDKRYAPLMVQAMPSGLPTLRNNSFVNSVVYGPGGTPRPQWKFVAPSSKSVAVLIRPAAGMDEAGTRRLDATVQAAVGKAHIPDATVTVSGVPVLAGELANEVRQEVPILGGIAVLAVSACFLLVPWTRWRRRLLPVVTTLLAICCTLACFGWLGHPLSLGVVAFLSVLLGIGSYYPTYFAQRAGKRTVLVVATGTAVSLSTLGLSPLPFVRDLGMTLSLGVLFAAALGLVLASRQSPADADEPVPSARGMSAAGGGLSQGARAGILTFVVVLGALGWAALPSLPLDNDFEHFAAGLPAMADAQHAESVIGSSGEFSVVLTGTNVTSVEALEWMRRAQDEVITDFGDQMHPGVSPPTLLGFLGDRPTPEQAAAAVRLLPPYLMGSVIDDQAKTARLSFGVDMNDIDRMRQLRDGLLGRLPAPPRGYHVALSGLPVVAARGSDLISGQRVLTNLAGIVGAGLVLAVGLRRRGDALRAVVAAAGATGIGLLLLQLTGTPLSPATVTLGSLTAAVGCEFTVLLAQARRTGNPALRRSVLLATGTSALGYAVLAASGLAMIRDFGLLLACSVLIALGTASCVVMATTRRQTAVPSRDITTHAPQSSESLTGVTS